MHPILSTFVKRAATLSLTLCVFGATGCYGGVYGDPAYYPSDGFIATEDPVYYNGEATYFYGGNWYYRNGNGWAMYRSEPGYLHQYRTAHPGMMRGAVGGGARRGPRAGGARGGSRGGAHGGRR